MLVVHLSTTRLAGAPIRLVRALQSHTDIEARLVDLGRWDQFEHDVVFAESADEAIDLCDRADVIHFHNYLDYETDAFRPIDFTRLRARGVQFVRQMHSTPETVAARMRVTPEDVVSSPIPSLVVAGLQERFYPRARVVRNVVPQDDPLYLPAEQQDGIAFAPSVPTGAWVHRWNTKGAPETIAMLERVRRRTGCSLRVVQGRPLPVVLREKQEALAVVDELVTGSYHVSGLEGLSVGKPVLSYLDERVRFVLAHVSGSHALPFLSVRLEDAEEVLVALVRRPDEAAELGRESRRWLETHWSERAIAQEYADLYRQLLEDPALVARQPALALDSAAASRTILLADAVWESRRADALARRPVRRKLLDRAGRVYRRLPLRPRLALRRLLGRPVP